MFGNGSVAEPYLINDENNLCAEAVNANSYTATMNIKSNEARMVEIVASNITEGYSLVLKDGENEIAMSEGEAYTTEIANGENADRFKLLINKKKYSRLGKLAISRSIRQCADRYIL